MATDNGSHSNDFSDAAANPTAESIVAQVGIERGYNDVFLGDSTGHVRNVATMMTQSGVPFNRTGISFVRDVLRGTHPDVRDEFLDLIGEPEKRGERDMHPNYVDTQPGDDLGTQSLRSHGFNPENLKAAREKVERLVRMEKVQAGLTPVAESDFVQAYRTQMMPGVANATKSWASDSWAMMQQQRPGYEDEYWNSHETLMQVAIRQADLTCVRLEGFAPRRSLNPGLPPFKQ